MKLLVVAADRMEFAGMASRPDRMLVAGGVGIKCSAAAAEKGIADFHPDAIVSTGFCGALALELKVADIVVATEVDSGESRYPCRPVESSKALQKGVVRTYSRVAQTVDERRKLRSAGAIAVEMEAATVAECARAHGLPFYCVKVVTDLAGETMANDFNRALREDGHFDTIKLLQGMLSHPFVRLPELVRLRGRCVQAAKALGDFFADCRF